MVKALRKGKENCCVEGKVAYKFSNLIHVFNLRLVSNFGFFLLLFKVANHRKYEFFF